MLKKIRVSIPCFHLKRTIHIYLPNDYYKSKRRYPVMYMFDGHNLFQDEDATYGKSWGLKKYMDEHNLPLIIVGIECNHEGTQRLSEFSPFTFEDPEWGHIEGKGFEFMNWVVHDLKPWIDYKYRTKSNRKHTSIAGSSMGGLMSLYSITWHNKTFSKAACLSSSFHFCDKQAVELTNEKMSPETKIYMSWGSDEVSTKDGFALECTYNLAVLRGLMKQTNQIYPNLIVNGRHCEEDWEKEVPVFMEYLFPEFFEQ